MSEIFSLRNAKPEIGTKVFCILSDERVFQSKSPMMFTRVLERVGVKGVYVPFMVRPHQLGEAVNSLKYLNIAGVNITVPFKESVIPFLDTISESAKIIGAINTIASDGQQLKGYNTNAIGLMDALESLGVDPTNKTALVFGSGGAARSAVFILNWLRSTSVTIAARNVEKAGVIADHLGGKAVSIDSLSKGQLQADIIVNATSVSDYHETGPLAEAVLSLDVSDCELLLDLNYGRSSNIWEDLARSRGIRFSDGLSTLAHQAKRTFALWTGIQVDPKEFLHALGEPG
jgi:shikimate dehydrogenase